MWYILCFFKTLNTERKLNVLKFKSDHQRCSMKNGVLKNFINFTGKHLYWSLFLIKLQTWGLEPAAFLKRDSNTGIKEHLKNTYFEEHLQTSASSNWTHIRHSVGILDIIWTSYVCSSYFLCPGSILNYYYLESQTMQQLVSNHIVCVWNVL